MTKSRKPSNLHVVSANAPGVEHEPSTPLDIASESSGVDSPSRDRIAERAYALYEARGRGDGRDTEDWLAAERELTNGRMPRED